MTQEEPGTGAPTPQRKATERVRSAVHGTVEQARKAGERGGEILRRTRVVAGTAGQSAARRVREAVAVTVQKAREGSARLGHSLKEGGELVQLTRRARALRQEMDGHFRAVGKRAFVLSKRARGENPFNRFPLIREELDRLGRLERKYRDVRTRIGEVRRDLRRRGR